MCGFIDICIQLNSALHVIKRAKQGGINANFCDKISISLREKNQIFETLKKFGFSRNAFYPEGVEMQCMLFFFIFAFPMQIWLFS